MHQPDEIASAMKRIVTRRAFVRTVAAGVAAGAMVRDGFSASGMATPRDIRKAVKFGMVRIDGSIRDKFLLLKQIGFDGVEMDSPNDLDAEEIIAARDAVGLTIHGVVDSVHWSKPFSHPGAAIRAEGVRALETAIRDCKRYGGDCVLVVPAVVNKNVSYAQAWERSLTEIRQVVPLAEETGIRVAFENVWNNFLLSPLEAARYVDAFESDAVGWYFDVGNVVRYGWPEQWIEVLGDRIFKLDVKEYSRRKQNDEGLWKGFDVELMEGDCDWPAVMTALDAIGFSGWATAEVAGGGPARLAFLAERMDRIFAQ